MSEETNFSSLQSSENNDSGPANEKLPRLQLRLNLNRKPDSEQTAAEVVMPKEVQSASTLAAMIDESMVPPQPTLPEGEFSKEMECVNCGLLADVDMDVDNCVCPDCGGTMYPSESIDTDKTITYQEEDDNDEELLTSDDGRDDGQRFRSIKVAQPISVGMFTSTGSGAVNTSASSSHLKGIDFLSTGSGSSLALSDSQKNCNAKMSELEMIQKNLEDEKAELTQQRGELDDAIKDFNEKRKAFEQYRLEYELQKQSPTASANPSDSTDSLNMAETLLSHDPLVMGSSRKEKMLLLTIVIMGILMLLQTVGLLILAFRK